MFCFLGAFALRNDMADVWLTMLFGVAGFVMRRWDLPIPPLVMGIILGPMAEGYFLTSMVANGQRPQRVRHASGQCRGAGDGGGHACVARGQRLMAGVGSPHGLMTRERGAGEASGGTASPCIRHGGWDDLHR